MLSKESENFLDKLRVELLFRGKDEDEVNEIDDELRDHLLTAEQNGEDVRPIIQTPVKSYADRFAKEMTLTQGLYKYVMYFIVFLLAIFMIPRMLDQGTFDVSVSLLLYIIGVFILGVVVQLVVMRKALVRWGDKKESYIVIIGFGIGVYLLMIAGEYLLRHYPIYTMIKLSNIQSLAIGIILLILTMIGCFIVKQKICAFIILIVSAPNLIAHLFTGSMSGNRETFIIISSVILLMISWGFIGYYIYKLWKLRKEDKRE
ncbi:hypothetical protein K1Y28_08885 [Staphylococcus warneri]|uniref:hypothetical protein n=1 Tax=Staphylococcus warneri TaxID=1292 RepID=UPI001E2C135D|nr:hypothetical protein [Staphylococcus warneri]MCD8804760.1 hypothetical protein [Staphylococcus warneri]MCD8807028.1 hypothetical protein [Staphylococcus warneri]MDK4214056.1 hypothetical protein [Staphylococcus warneri]